MNIKEAIRIVNGSKDLTSHEMAEVMTSMFKGDCSENQIIEFLDNLQEKGESISELTGAVEVMRNFSLKVQTDTTDLVDCCGTGGLGKSMMNVSTSSAFVAAASGIKIAKHGNRSATGTSGSADLLEAAGLKLSLNSQSIAECINQIGIGFIFAQNHHPGMKYVMSARKKIGKKTVFNLLGPLTNPAGALMQAIGVFDAKWVIPVAETLQKLGAQRALVFHSLDGLDEISIADKTYLAELRNNKISELELDPKLFGMNYDDLEALKVKSPEDSYKKVIDALNGSFDEGSSIVKLNAGAVIYLSGKTKSIEEGVLKADEYIKNGESLKKLDELVSMSQQLF